MKILWIGPIINPDDVGHYKAVSPAGNKWQIGLFFGLKEHGINLKNLSYLPEPFFPKGNLVPHFKSSKKEMVCIDYLNLPFIRNNSLSAGLIHELKNNKDVDYLITYNNSIPHIRIGKYAQKILTKKWINIVADDYFIEGPDLTVFLSYGYYIKAKLQKKVHIDGGIDKIAYGNKSKKSSLNVILYAGNISKRNGIEKFAMDFSKLNFNNIELHIYGKGNSPILRKLTIRHPHIKVKGFVPNEILEKAMIECSAFINPKILTMDGIESDFPSKLLDYFRFGNPVISSRQVGLAPYYDDLIFYYDPSDPLSMKKAITQSINMSSNEMHRYRERLKKFQKEHTWYNMAHNLLNAISNI